MLDHNYTGTPEHYLNIPKVQNHGDIDIDALSRTLDRAESLCILLASQFDGSVDQLDNGILLGATDALEGVIAQAQMLLGGTREQKVSTGE